MIFRVGWLSFCRDQGSTFPMSQAFDFMSSLQSSESGIIVPILQMKLDMQTVSSYHIEQPSSTFLAPARGQYCGRQFFPRLGVFVCVAGGEVVWG